jgi:hypothetical protein
MALAVMAGVALTDEANKVKGCREAFRQICPRTGDFRTARRPSESKAVEVNILEDHVLIPLLHHMHAHESYKNKAASEQERARHNEISFECMTWHAHLETVLNGLK